MFERQYNLLTTREVPSASAPASGGVVRAADEPEFTTVGRGGRAMQFTSDSIFKHLQAVRDARGKKV